MYVSRSFSLLLPLLICVEYGRGLRRRPWQHQLYLWRVPSLALIEQPAWPVVAVLAFSSLSFAVVAAMTFSEKGTFGWNFGRAGDASALVAPAFAAARFVFAASGCLSTRSTYKKTSSVNRGPTFLTSLVNGVSSASTSATTLTLLSCRRESLVSTKIGRELYSCASSIVISSPTSRLTTPAFFTRAVKDPSSDSSY